jgi:hypothetical protein
MFIIKDTKQNCWLEVDRIVDGYDIRTIAEPVYNYKAATEFRTQELADKVIEQIKSEGEYDTEGYIKEDKDELQALEKQEQQKEVDEAKAFIEQKQKELEDELRAQGKSEEVIKQAVEAFKGITQN